jgi:uracil-DNA glycosylase
MLWGSYAQKKASFVDGSKHLVLKAPHPSPLSAHSGFFGCRHFSKANDFLQQRGSPPIDWALPEAASRG